MGLRKMPVPVRIASGEKQAVFDRLFIAGAVSSHKFVYSGAG
jgi:hypothetical protein